MGLWGCSSEMYYIKGGFTTCCITAAGGSFVAEGQKLEGRRSTRRREPKRERLGMTWALRSLCRPSTKSLSANS